MRFITGLASAITALCSLSNVVDAHSKRREPLNYLSILDQPTIKTPSYRVHAHSEFEVTFTLHRGGQRIRLTLEPNHDVLPPGAFINYVDAHGNTLRTETIDRTQHKIFKGTAWRAAPGDKGFWEKAGDCSLNVYRDGKTPLFEGAFGLGLDDHTIQLRSNYQKTKHDNDVDLEELEDDYMLVWRSQDISEKPQGYFDQAVMSDESPIYSHMYQPWEQKLRRRAEAPVFDRDVTVRSDAGSWGSMNIRHLFGKRQQTIDGSGQRGNSGVINLRNAIGNTTGCPTQKKVALMGVAADCNYVSQFNSTQSVRDNIITQISTASGVYEKTFNITLGIANLTVTDAQCPSSASSALPWNVGCGPLDVQARLGAFSGWRGQQVDLNAFWMLLSNCPTGDEVGLSWTGALCQRRTDNGNNGTGANIVIKTSTEWQVMAHETAHTFGAVHDCDSSACQNTNFVNSQGCCPVSADGCDANRQFIMNPSISSNSINKFSPCTIGNICTGMGTKAINSTCLVDNVKVPLVSQQQCGNGIVEQGEDCDCGGTANCGSNSCCDASTCKFKNGAQCDDSNESCCHQCKFASSGTVCRSSTGSCDPEEKCPGNSGACPKDSFQPDGNDCGSGLQCASGQCTSRTLQCRQLMGTSLTKSNDTVECGESDCQVSCKSPEFGANVCYQMQQNFLDGTVCGGDGRCRNGACQGSTAGGQIKSWIDSNKPLVIGIACGVGGLILLSILCCIISSIRRRKAKQRVKDAQARGWNGSGFSSGGGPPPGTTYQPVWPGPHQGGDPGYQMHQYGGHSSSVRYA